METLPLHPAIVHFPIAIFVIIGLLGIVSIFKEQDFIKRMIFWLFIMGILAAIASIATGLYTEERLVHNEAIHDIMEKHEANAFIVSGFFVLMFVWFWIRKKIQKKREYVIWVIFILIGCGFLGYQNYLGGKMVYEHGAGIIPMEKIIKQESGEENEHHH